MGDSVRKWNMATEENKDVYVAYEDLRLTSFITTQRLKWLDYTLKLVDSRITKRVDKACAMKRQSMFDLDEALRIDGEASSWFV